MIPVFSLERQNIKIGKDISKAIKGVIERGVFILGPKVKEFERGFAEYIGVKHAVGVASGTDALSLSLLAVGVEPGDEVIVPANSYPTAFAVTAIGAVPKLVDIDPVTFTIDPAKIPEAITKKTKAVIPVHLYGQPADLASIQKIRNVRTCSKSVIPSESASLSAQAGWRRSRGIFQLSECGRSLHSPAKAGSVGMTERKPFKQTLRHIRDRQKICIIEDCAQAHGAEVKINNPITQLSNKYQLSNYPIIQSVKKQLNNETMKQCNNVTMRKNHKKKGEDYEWKKAGSIGDAGCFSFYPTKNLGCFGDGGMVVTDNKEIADRVRLLRMYGEESRYKSVVLGRNSRLDEIQAAILLVKLKHLDEWNGRRREIAELYFNLFSLPISLLAHSPLSPLSKRNDRKPARANNKIILPTEILYTKHVYHLFVIRVKERDKLKKFLEEKGIGTAIHYPVPVHLAPSFAFLGYKKGDFPESEKASREILSLPMWPELKDGEVERVVKEILQFVAANKLLKELRVLK